MAKIQNETAYRVAMERIEELLPLVDDTEELMRIIKKMPYICNKYE